MEQRVIYKYQLDYGQEFTLWHVPAGAAFLDAQNQHETICVWAECDPNQPTLPVQFRIVGTGMSVDLEGWDYIGTVQQQFSFVWHIYYQWSE